MECKNKDEAEKAMAEAEQCFKANDLSGANKHAKRAQGLYPSHLQLPRLLAALDVHSVAAAAKSSEPTRDYRCKILGSNPRDDIQTIKSQYRKMCLLTHPDKNPSAAAEGAFKLVSDAWEALLAAESDKKSCNSKNNDDGSSSAQPNPGSDTSTNTNAGPSTQANASSDGTSESTKADQSTKENAGSESSYCNQNRGQSNEQTSYADSSDSDSDYGFNFASTS